VALKADGTLDTSKLTSGASEYYSQTYASVSMTGSTLVPYFPGFAVSMDTGSLVLVDEQLARIMVWTCSNYSLSTGALSMIQDTTCSSVGPAYSTSYGTAAYKDVEFVSMMVNSSTPLPLANPSKMFLTSLQDPLNARGKMYVQCTLHLLGCSRTRAPPSTLPLQSLGSGMLFLCVIHCRGHVWSSHWVVVWVHTPVWQHAVHDAQL